MTKWGVRGLSLVPAAALAMTGAVVQAQETGSLIQRRTATITDQNAGGARLTLRQFGQCAVQSTARVQAFLQTRMDAPDYFERLNKLASPNCLSDGNLKIPQSNMRAAVFEALYNKEYRSASHVFPPEMTSGFTAQYPGSQPSSIENILVLEQVGECVSKRDAKAARALLLTRPTSAEETGAIAALIPHFQACIPNGQTFSLSKTVARGAVAEGLYWLTKAMEAATVGR